MNKPMDRLIKIEDVLDQVGCSRSKLYLMIQFEEFPAQVKLGRYSRWSQLEVQSWIESMKQKRAA
ncbi:AlpA family phage regulatory protein [Ectopseudomonas hydrolytica]|jgi:prophage regulatory protein|uniref:AlpA family phage regulatory protein n=1 Tax=Ectopseudomonas hydrolytica TaxID=2493633 RepID=A0ABY5A2W7_9GAMM|nr:AlpA family phage regulatory protein [Pseudomonas hydrolytica]USR38130.1 AlpA family phage regulatory protein [Pseudomonas hydrolytica]